MLRPLYTRRPFELMLIGEPYSGKRTISKQFLKCRDVFFSINVANSLPQKNIKRTDYVILLIDLTNKTSLEQLENALRQIESRYLLNKTAIVVTKVDIPERWAYEKADIEELVELYSGLDVFYVNLDDVKDRKATVDQITQLIKIETLQYKNIDTDYIKSQEFLSLPPDYEPAAVEEQGETEEEENNTSRLAEQRSHLTEEQRQDSSSVKE